MYTIDQIVGINSTVYVNASGQAHYKIEVTTQNNILKYDSDSVQNTLAFGELTHVLPELVNLRNSLKASTVLLNNSQYGFKQPYQPR